MIISIIIADDHQLFADSIEMLLNSMPEYTVKNKVTTGKKLLHLLNSTTADIIVLDISMPEMTGLEAAEIIRKRFPEQKILIVSMYSNKQIIQQCKEMGINGFLMKDTTAEIFDTALKKIMKGEEVYYEGQLYSHYETKLSAREKEILQLICSGNTSFQIAEKLHLSKFTIDNHRRNIYKKFKVSSLAILIQLANQSGLV